MKRLSPVPVAVALSLLVCLQATAQQDSVTVTYDEEPAETSNFSIKEKYKYWTRATVEEKYMLKAGLSGLGYGGSYGWMLEHTFAFEKKINVPFSVLAQYRQRISGWRSNYLGLDVAVRYYYSLPRRIRRGKSANNLSANYFSIQLDNTWTGSADWFVLQGRPVFTDYQTRRFSQASLLYGIQRRLGKHGYVDFNVGAAYRIKQWFGDNRYRLNSDANFSIGL